MGSKKFKRQQKNLSNGLQNSNEAIREISLDIKEGADMIMIKPALPYLDIIKLAKESFKIPIIAYQVSGEYSLLTNAIRKGLIDDNSIIETLYSFKRVGSNAIVTYFADRIVKFIK